jgi:exonuclease VII large subunit
VEVRALIAAVRTHVEREYSDAWVEGEISNFRANPSCLGLLDFSCSDVGKSSVLAEREWHDSWRVV